MSKEDKLAAIRRGVAKRANLDERKKRADVVGAALVDWEHCDKFEQLLAETTVLNNKGNAVINANPQCSKAAKEANLLFIKADTLRNEALGMWQSDFPNL